MNKWDILLLRYPFTDLTTTKVRPALLISPDAIAKSDDGVFIAITSNAANPGPYDVLVQTGHPEFSMAGLRCASLIKLSKIFTLKKTLVTKRLGDLGPILQGEVESQLRRFFELPK
jgi:mRNA interferase MazF